MSTDHPSPEPAQQQFAFEAGYSRPSDRSGRVWSRCQRCGVEFEHPFSRPRVCCDDCAPARRGGGPRMTPPADRIPTEEEASRIPGYEGRVRRVCPWCNEEFVSQASRKKRCCSRSCGTLFQRQEARKAGRPLPGRKHTGEDKPCEICGETIYVKVWQAKIGQGRFCSRDCFNVWQARDSRSLTCDWCGEPFQVRPSSPSRFCSWDCQVEGKRTKALDREHNGRRVQLRNPGYIYVWEPDHPKAFMYDGWYPEHRLVVEKQIGRVLETEEIIHHKDGQKDNNAPDNLQLVTKTEHQELTKDQIVERRRAMKAKLAAYEARFGPLSDDTSDGSEATS